MNILNKIFGNNKDQKRTQEEPFLLYIDNIFKMKEENTVVIVGLVKAGTCKSGDTAMVINGKNHIQVLIEGIEKNYKKFYSAIKGENVALLVKPVDGYMVNKDTVKVGYKVVIIRD